MMVAAAAAADDSLGASAAPAAPADAPSVSSSGGIVTPIAPLEDSSSSDGDGAGNGDDDDDELPLTLDKALEEGVNRAMRGDTGVLRQVLAPGVEWRGPLGTNVGLARVEGELRGLGNLLSEPRMSVSASLDGARKLEWVGSGTWRLPWLPRFIVRGASTVETGADGKVCALALSLSLERFEFFPTRYLCLIFVGSCFNFAVPKENLHVYSTRFVTAVGGSP